LPRDPGRRLFTAVPTKDDELSGVLKLVRLTDDIIHDEKAPPLKLRRFRLGVANDELTPECIGPWTGAGASFRYTMLSVHVMTDARKRIERTQPKQDCEPQNRRGYEEAHNHQVTFKLHEEERDEAAHQRRRREDHRPKPTNEWQEA